MCSSCTGFSSALVRAALILGIAACSGDDEPRYEVLAVTEATVEAGLDFVSAGQIAIPASCGATIPVNCPGGTAGTAGVVLTRTALTITSTGAQTFDFTADIAVTTPAPIPITIQGAACGFSVNTAPGASPTIRVSGTADFASQTVGGPVNRLDITAVVSQSLESEDVVISGVSLTCDLANSSVSFFQEQLAALLDQVAHLCGAPGPTLLVRCTPTADGRGGFIVN